MDGENIAHVNSSGKCGEVFATLSIGASDETISRSPGQLAVEFLRSFDPEGRHNLVAIVPDGYGTEGRTFPPGRWDEISQWVDVREGRANVYFSVNEPAPGSPDKRLKADDIGKIRAAHCDVDPIDGEALAVERLRLADLAARVCSEPESAPSYAIDSGGGVQFLWRMNPRAATADGRLALEAQNRGICAELGGDRGTHDIARILRLPGTTNLPDARKRAKGRERRRSTLIGGSGRAVAAADLAKRYPPKQQGKREDADEKITEAQSSTDMAMVTSATTYDDLSKDLRAKFEASCLRNPRLRQLWEGDASVLGDDKSGSGWRAALARALGRACERYSAEELGSLCWVWDHAVQREEDRESKLDDRAIARDWARCYWPDSSDRIVDLFWEPPRATEELFPQAASSNTCPVSIDWVNPADWAGISIPPRKWLVDGLIPEGETTLIYGDGGIGKTLLLQQYAICAATGRSWLGQATKSARVMLYLCEDRIDEIHRRHAALCKAIGVRMEDTSNMRLCSRREEDNLLSVWDAKAGRMRRLPIWEQLVADAKAFQADVVILDTIADIYGGNEVDRAQVNAFVKTCLGRLGHEIGGSVIALGHPSQAGLQTGSGTSGSTHWNNAVRSRLYLRYPEKVSSGDVRELQQMKSNYGPKGSVFKLKWDSGAFSVIAAKTLPQSPSQVILPGIESIADAAEKALFTAIATQPTARLNPDAPNSAFYAPKVLKRLEPDVLLGWTEKELADAMNAAIARGALKTCEVGRDGSRRPILGLSIVADKLSVKLELLA